MEGGRRGDSLETPTRKRQGEEEPGKEAWREKPEKLLKLATKKLKRMALRKDACLEEPEGNWKEMEPAGRAVSRTEGSVTG